MPATWPVVLREKPTGHLSARASPLACAPICSANRHARLTLKPGNSKTWKTNPSPDLRIPPPWQAGFASLEYQEPSLPPRPEKARGFGGRSTAARCPKPRRSRGEAVGPAPVGVRPQAEVRSPPKVWPSDLRP